jgi:hypothetical protein
VLLLYILVRTGMLAVMGKVRIPAFWIKKTLVSVRFKPLLKPC